MRQNSKKEIGVLGAGSWGTALACLLADNGHQVTLWSHNHDHLNKLAENRSNERHLPGISFPDGLTFEHDLKKLCSQNSVFLLVVPSRAFADTLDKLIEANLPEDSLIMWGTKGFDSENQQLLSDLVSNKVKQAHQQAIISGPSFALEVMHKHPTALTAGASDIKIAEQVAKLFHNDYTRVYPNDDLAGVQVGGAVKNVLAIACGISDGLGFGANARSALITRGLVEITRLGKKMGANPETFQGLSGLGDLVLTCTDNKSRNRRFGLGIGSGKNIPDVLAEIGQEVEGYVTCQEVKIMAKKFAVDMPICELVYEIVHNGVKPSTAVKMLLDRAISYE